MIKIIYINSPIGMGKTSLTHILTEKFGTKGFYENVDDIPMLKDFYSAGEESRSEMSFRLQIAFLNYRYQQLREGLYLQQEYNVKNTVYDSSLLSDGLMALNLYKRGEFDETAYRLYTELSQNMQANVSGHPFTGLPNLVIYLHGDFDLMLKHIVKRGREMEALDPDLINYYKSVWETYEAWNESFGGTSKIVIDMNQYDFVNNIEDRIVVLREIYKTLRDLGQLSSVQYTELERDLESMGGDKEYVD